MIGCSVCSLLGMLTGGVGYVGDGTHFWAGFQSFRGGYCWCGDKSGDL